MKFIPTILCLLLMLGFYLEKRTYPSIDDATPFHARAAAMIADVPFNIGSWEGVDREVATAAQALLRPNAILSRSFQHKDTGEYVNLMLVQTRDSRDMGGHYPPICYPGQGWKQEMAGTNRKLVIDGRSVPFMYYRFSKPNFDRTTEITIYNFFALPAKGFAPDMDSVRAAAADYRYRAFGAAQIQVVFADPGLTDERRDEVFTELVAPLMPIVELIAHGPDGRNS